MKTLSRAGRITATVTTTMGALAFGLAGFAGTASAAEELATSFEVCSPLGCQVQRVQGTVEVVGGQTRVNATVTDSAPAAALRTEFTMSGGTFFTIVDNSTQRVSLMSPKAETSLTVSACATSGGCNTKIIPVS